MLAQIRKLGKKGTIVLWLVIAGTLASCASQRENVTLVQDPDEKKDSMIPWNKQEKWETDGGSQLAGGTDRR